MAHHFFRIIVVTIIFIAIISFPIINDEIKFVKDMASSENRQMVSKPSLYFEHLDPYPGQFEKYYNDHFSIRFLLVKYYNLMNLMVFKKSPIPDQVVIGNDGWLFMAGNEINSYKGNLRFEKSELEALKDELEYRKQYLNKRGCQFYFLIAPVKSSIYSDKIPNHIFRVYKQSLGEQLIEYLNKNSEVKPVNVYQVLRLNREKEWLYYKLDNHWNQLGAFYAANEALRRINMDFPEISASSLDEFVIKKTETKDGNIISMLSNVVIFKDYSFQLTPKSGFLASDVSPAGYACVPNFAYPSEFEKDKEIKNSKKLKILIISDSFGGNVFPFLAEHFGRSVKIFDSWQYKLNEDIVEKEKPDVVLLISLETGIKNILNFQSRLKNKPAI